MQSDVEAYLVLLGRGMTGIVIKCHQQLEPVQQQILVVVVQLEVVELQLAFLHFVVQFDVVVLLDVVFDVPAERTKSVSWTMVVSGGGSH